MQTRFTLPAQNRDHALEIAARLKAFIMEGDDRIEVFSDKVRLETTDPVRVVADLDSDGFFE